MMIYVCGLLNVNIGYGMDHRLARVPTTWIAVKERYTHTRTHESLQSAFAFTPTSPPLLSLNTRHNSLS